MVESTHSNISSDSGNTTERVELLFREAKVEDASHYQQLMCQLRQETSYLIFDTKNDLNDCSALRELLAQYEQASSSIILVVELAGELIATANLSVRNLLEDLQLGEVGIAVIKEYWGCGIGSALIDSLIDFAEQTSLNILTLEVLASNHRAINLYRKFGFCEIGRSSQWINQDGKYYDTIVMEKPLGHTLHDYNA